MTSSWLLLLCIIYTLESCMIYGVSFYCIAGWAFALALGGLVGNLSSEIL